MGTSQTKKGIPARYLRTIAFCVICVALNAVGAFFALRLNLPVYLDSLGTVLVAMVGGFVPGIAVGYATNLVNSVVDPLSMYYGIINVFIAILTALMARRGWFHRLSRTLAAVGVLAVFSTLLSSLLAFFLNQGSLASELTAPFAQQLMTLNLPEIPAELIALLFVNIIDKALVVLLATLVYHMLPEGLLNGLDFIPWQQAALSKDDLDDVMDIKPRGISLSIKLGILVAVIMSVVAVSATAFSYMTFHQSTIDLEVNKARGITALAAESIDPNKVADYLALGEGAPGFVETEARLADIRDSFDNVQYVYVYQIRSDGCHVVLDPDTAEEPGSDPGSVVEFDEAFQADLPTLLSGGEIDPIISNESYGWLLTVYTPLKNDAGDTVCYVCADLSMERLISNESTFVAGILALFAAFFILVCAIVLWLTRYGIVVPVNSIAKAASNFLLTESGMRKENLEPLDELDIVSGDEIENLYDAVNQMSQSVVIHMEDAQEKSEAISRMQSNLIMVLADLVESRDKFTGDHVRNTAAYTRVIMNQMRREGICPDVLTNEFISNVYQSAPLHDIGKIAVPDAILNKPGRLTDEEFEAMKGHTLAGQEILQNARGAVAESSYLDEAERLAAFHHEKWNGTGYPYGLAGEEIPLSARIMAVADVFDALVSKRSYKEGFPPEKAFAIIEEGIGTHFDPQVARAFLHAQDKARAVVEQTKEREAEREAAAKAAAEEKAAAEAEAAAKAETEAKKAAEAKSAAEDAPATDQPASDQNPDHKNAE